MGSLGYTRGKYGSSDVVNIILEGSGGPWIYFCDYANDKLDNGCARKVVNQLNLSWRTMWALITRGLFKSRVFHFFSLCGGSRESWRDLNSKKTML